MTITALSVTSVQLRLSEKHRQYFCLQTCGQEEKGEARQAGHQQCCLPFISHPGALAGVRSFAGSLVLLVFVRCTLIFSWMHTLPAANRDHSGPCFTVPSLRPDVDVSAVERCCSSQLCRPKCPSPGRLSCACRAYCSQFLIPGRM